MEDLKSLANREDFPKGVGVAINKEMFVWDNPGQTRIKIFILCWSGFCFISESDIPWFHACHIPTKTTRPMTHKEIFQLRDVVFRFKYKKVDHISAEWKSTSGISSWTYCHKDNLVEPLEDSPWKKLDVEE